MPPEIADLTGLELLDLDETQIGDLTPIVGLAALEILQLNSTQVSNLSPIGKLTALQSLALMDTLVSDLRPIAGLVALTDLWLSYTQISDLSPVAGLKALTTLAIGGTQVADLRPISGLTSLQVIWLNGTQVSDLTPIARITSLQDAAVAEAVSESRVRGDGLIYEDTPAAGQYPFNHILRLDQPALTVETINELRRQQGLPEHMPESYERPSNFEEMLGEHTTKDDEDPSDAETAAALAQRPATYSFPYAGGRFRAKAQVSPPADLALATDIYAELKAKALEARTRLATCNAPKRLQQTIDRLLADLGASLENVAPGKLLMRSRSLDADVTAYDTNEARREIAEEALAQFIDVATSVADLKSCYPAITKLEAARVAQDLLAKNVGATLEHMTAIRNVAAASEAVDPSAVEALRAGEPEIEHANEIIADKQVDDAARIAATEKRAETAAQMLLDHRNFVASVLKIASDLFGNAKEPAAAVAKGLGSVTSETLTKFAKKAPGPLSDVMVATSVGALAGLVLGPTAGLAGFLATYKPLAKKGTQLAKAAAKLAKAAGSRRSKPSRDRGSEAEDSGESP